MVLLECPGVHPLCQEESCLSLDSIQYKVQNSNVFKYKNVTANSVETNITGLDLGTVYRVYVAGVNAIGTGLYCCGRISVVM